MHTFSKWRSVTFLSTLSWYLAMVVMVPKDLAEHEATQRGVYMNPGKAGLPTSSVVSCTLARCQSMKVLSSFSRAQLFLPDHPHI